MFRLLKWSQTKHEAWIDSTGIFRSNVHLQKFCSNFAVTVSQQTHICNVTGYKLQPSPLVCHRFSNKLVNCCSLFCSLFLWQHGLHFFAVCSSSVDFYRWNSSIVGPKLCLRSKDLIIVLLHKLWQPIYKILRPGRQTLQKFCMKFVLVEFVR